MQKGRIVFICKTASDTGEHEMRETEAIEQALAEEHGTMARQELLKRLWKVRQRIDEGQTAKKSDTETKATAAPVASKQ
jgi:hypothetical protein